MDFALSEEQKLFDRSLRRLMSERLPMERRRAAAARAEERAALFSRLVAHGIAGLAVPARYGGAGLGILDAALAAECLGYHAVPAAFAASLVMAPLAILWSGNPATQEEWLPKIAAGTARIAVGFAGPIGQTGAATVGLAEGRLSGRIERMLDGAGA